MIYSSSWQLMARIFRFLVKELFRVVWDGRNVAVHCMDLPIQKGKEGYIGLRDFSGLIREVFESGELTWADLLEITGLPAHVLYSILDDLI